MLHVTPGGSHGGKRTSVRGRCASVAVEMDPAWASGLTAAVLGGGALLFLVKRRSEQQRARDKVQAARRRRDASLRRAEEAVRRFQETVSPERSPRTPEPFLTSRLDPAAASAEVLSLSPAELAAQCRDGALSPRRVLHVYMEKALEVQEKLNCCTDFLMESQQQLAQLEGQRDGLLYGVPVSIKDSLGYTGHDSSCGVICKLEDPAAEDSVVVKVLKRQGAIPFMKTNIPQGLLNYDCSNPIYGLTLNPQNPQKTPGGSSGGEGALIGGGGSILGLGTDIGGSIRIPASFCGICGFKPTSNRISMRGLSSCCPGQKSVGTSIGPMARDVDSLALCMKALLCENMFVLDPTVPPIPFNEQVYLSTKRLRIGYYENDGMQQPSPSMSRALRDTKDLLERAGHTVCMMSQDTFYLNPPLSKIHGWMFPHILFKLLKGGPIDPCLKGQTVPYGLPWLVKKVLSVLLKPIVLLTLNLLVLILQNYIHEVVSEWRRLELDVMLCPMLGPAYNHTYAGKLTCALPNTTIYNLLNFPAGAVPVSTVTAEDEANLNHYKGNFQDYWDKVFVKAVRGAEGLPVAVQCVALPWQDELCLRFMREVEQLVREKNQI
uniref:Fatty-acid amide hydrolase 1 n=1 Tax=Denticeps clupeoides TaxID=299321 RepID=A0AAY4DKG0_9TELE